MIMQFIQTRVAAATLVAITALLLAGCGGGGSGSTSSDGLLTLRVTDAPVDDLCEVWVTFSEVHLVPGDDGGLIKFDESNTDSLPASIELTRLDQGDSVALLDHASLPAGKYNQIRLVIAETTDAYVVVGEEDENGECLPPSKEQPLTCPSCRQSGLKLNLDGFTLDAEGLVEFTIDFDLEKSIISPNQGYLLKPVHTVTNTFVYNTQFTGTVTDSQDQQGNPINPVEDCNVYVYQGDVQPDDNCSNEYDTAACDAIGAQSYRSATLYGTESPYYYLTGYMETGPYTVTLACGDDDPLLDDDLTFIGTKTVQATSGLNEFNFQIPPPPL